MSTTTTAQDTQERIQPPTKWNSWHHKTKPAIYLDAVKGIGMTNSGQPFTCAPELPASQLVEALPAGIETAYLCGQLPESPQVTTQDNQLYSPFNSWVIGADPEQMYLASGTDHSDTMAIVRREDGSAVTLRTIASWTGTNDLSPREVHEALGLVTKQLRAQPNWKDVCLLKTPSITGQELWRTTMGVGQQPDGTYRSVEDPLLPEDIRDLIHRTSGQGRFEVLPCPTPDGMAPNLYYLDDRLAYAARAASELGIGPVIHDFGSQYEGYRPARYRVAFRIPEDWNHVGCLPVQRARTPGAEAIGLEFPWVPGYIGERG